VTGRIDTHHHIVPKEYATWLVDQGQRAGGLPIPEWSVEGSLAVMDAAGIDVAVLSVSTPGVHLGDDDDARAMARRVNETAAEAMKDHPDRFGFFATLTLPDVDGALDELAYAFDELHADGVVLLANVRGQYLGDPAFDPLFEELDRRHAVVFVHPSVLPGVEPVPGVPPFVADFLLDTTRAAINLGASGTLDRSPNIEVILSHAGGFVPYAAWRLSRAAGGIENLQRFWFDTALSGSPTALPSLLAFAGPDRVLYGSDWPYAAEPIVQLFTNMYEQYELDPSQRASIDRGAAEQLFGRFST
jgi:6-methylsalicylate decarboxylase